MSAASVLRQGARGEGVRDLQNRLNALGFAPAPDPAGIYGPATFAAVRAFQEARGIRVDGACGPETWAALVESGFTLGDRLLYDRRPMLRGDDVADLQHRLNALGFDAGRADGIFGPDTSRALQDFQRNAGLAPDGIGGPEAVEALLRLGGMAAGSVAEVREREALRGPRRVKGMRVYVATGPELHGLGDALVHRLTDAGADAILDPSGADDGDLAAAANDMAADLFVSLRLGPEPGCRCIYFASPRFQSEGGRRVASGIASELARWLPVEPEPVGRAYRVLRETRMAAVVCELAAEADAAALGALVERGGDIARAAAAGVRAGVESDYDPPVISR